MNITGAGANKIFMAPAPAPSKLAGSMAPRSGSGSPALVARTGCNPRFQRMVRTGSIPSLLTASLKSSSRLMTCTLGLLYVLFLEDMSSFLMKNNLSSEDVKKCPNVLLFGILNN